MKNAAPLWLVVLAIAACATQPSFEGGEPIHIAAYGWVYEKDPLTGARLPLSRVEPLAGVACSIGNGMASWALVAPADVQVPSSGEPLRFECTKPGYGPARGELACLSQSSRRNARLIALATQVALAVAIGVHAPESHSSSSFSGSSFPTESMLWDHGPTTQIAERTAAGIVGSVVEGTAVRELGEGDAPGDCTYLDQRAHGVLEVHLVPD